MFVPDTQVRLISNVPLSTSYENQMTFTNKTEQANYFKGKAAYTFNDFTYVRKEGTINVGANRDSLYNCNYLMFRNSNFSNKWFYAFITELEYSNPNNTLIHFEIDVYQTWQFDIEFKPSFVVREHARRFNSDGSPIINTIDEGLDYGTEYDIVNVENIKPNGGYKWLVMVSKEALHLEEREVKPAIIGAPQPLTYYITPFKDTDTVPSVILPDGVDVPVTPPVEVMRRLYKSENAANNIVSIYVTDHIGVQVEIVNNVLSFYNVGASGIDAAAFDDVYTLVVNKVASFYPDTIEVGSKYEGFSEVTESKLLMHPYTVTVLDDFKGNRVEYKNEHINDKDLTLVVKGSLGLSNKTSWGVNKYNQTTTEQLFKANNEHALINNNPNDVPVVTEMLAAYLQGNRNSLATQKASSLFNATLGGTGALMGAVGGAMVGGPVGAIAGGGMGLASSIGSSYYQIQALNSKRKDIENTPPQISKMGSNTAYDFGNGYEGMFVIKKQIKPEYIKKLTDFFKMYGYKIHEVKTPNLRSRHHFNFIQTKGATITGNVPQNDLSIIKTMFDNGVTLWHTSDVGNYSLANGER